jgi:hypothetical protein
VVEHGVRLPVETYVRRIHAERSIDDEQTSEDIGD